MKTFAIVILLFASMVFAQVGVQETLTDVNIADRKTLLAAPHMTPEIVKGILEARPFLDMKDLNAYLSKSLNQKQREEAYEKIFVHLNLNSATENEVLMIPRIEKTMVQEFLKHRPYKNLTQFRNEIRKFTDLNEVKRFEQYVFVPIPLNTASDDNIMTIPGMGPKMLHEFKEYRPYKNIEQFRREIGKYVNDKEVARLERYVTLN